MQRFVLDMSSLLELPLTGKPFDSVELAVVVTRRGQIYAEKYPVSASVVNGKLTLEVQQQSGGGGGVSLPATATQPEMEAGTEVSLRMVSPLLVAQAIAALAGGGGDATNLADGCHGPADDLTINATRVGDCFTFNGATNLANLALSLSSLGGSRSMADNESELEANCAIRATSFIGQVDNATINAVTLGSLFDEYGNANVALRANTAGSLSYDGVNINGNTIDGTQTAIVNLSFDGTDYVLAPIIADKFIGNGALLTFSAPMATASYTLATLPAASSYLGSVLSVTDNTLGCGLCKSDGSNWIDVNTNLAVA